MDPTGAPEFVLNEAGDVQPPANDTFVVDEGDAGFMVTASAAPDVAPISKDQAFENMLAAASSLSAGAGAGAGSGAETGISSAAASVLANAEMITAAASVVDEPGQLQDAGAEAGVMVVDATPDMGGAGAGAVAPPSGAAASVAAEHVVAAACTETQSADGGASVGEALQKCAFCGVDKELVTAAMATQSQDADITKKTLEQTMRALDGALQAQGTLANRVAALEASIADSRTKRVPTVERMVVTAAAAAPASASAPVPVPRVKTPLEEASELLNARCAELLRKTLPTRVVGTMVTAGAAAPAKAVAAPGAAPSAGRGVKRALAEPTIEDRIKERTKILFGRA